jgi:hypothetical protein
MKRKTVFFVVLCILALAGIAWAAAGDSLLRTRYGITSTVAEINYSDGVTSNIQTQLDAKSTSALADTKIFVGSAAGLATAQTMSGDATIANSGAVSLVANGVAQPELDYAVKDIYIDAAASSGTATVESGAIILGAYGIANIDDIGAEMINSVSISGTTLTLVVNGVVAGDSTHYGVAVLNP